MEKVTDENLVDDRAQSLRTTGAKTVLTAVSLSHFLNHLSMTVIAFLIPTIVAKELGLNTVQVGMLSAATQLTSGVFQLTFSMLIGFMKRNLLFSLGNALQAISAALSLAVRGFTDLLFLRFLWGIGSAPQHPVGSSLLSESFDRRGRNLALSVHMGVAYLGNMVGPSMAAYLASGLGWRWASLLVGIPQLLMATAFVMLARGERSTDWRANGAGRGTRHVMGSLWTTLTNRNLMTVNLAQVFATAGRGLNLWITYLPIYLMTNLGYDLGSSAVIVGCFLATGSLGTIVLGWASQRFNKMKIATVSTLLTSLGLLSLATYDGPPSVAAAIAISLGFVSLEVIVALQSYIADVRDPVTRDAALGVFFTVGFLAASFWTFLMGLLVESYGFRTAFLFMASLNIPSAFFIFRLRSGVHGTDSAR